MSHTAPRTWRKAGIIASGAAMLLVLSACTSAPAAESETGNAAGVTGDCGQLASTLPGDPDGVLAGMPRDIQDAYVNYPTEITTSFWSDLAAKDGPLTVGYSSDSLKNPFLVNMKAEVERSFEEAKAAGIVEGELKTKVMASADTETPAQQISDYQALVREGADVILLKPLDSAAMINAVTEAGEAGIPTVVLFASVDSPYAINTQPNPYLQTALPLSELISQIDGEGDILIVRGVLGLSFETDSYNTLVEMIDACPGLSIAGEVVGNFSGPTTKTAVLQFLATHPGQIDAVFQVGNMAPGVIGAFEQAGRDVPPVLDNGAVAASLGYWLTNLDNGYATYGTTGSGATSANIGFRVAMRVMAGNGVRADELSFMPELITSKNVADYVEAGTDLNSSEEAGGPLDGGITDAVLDQYFTTAGNPLTK